MSQNFRKIMAGLQSQGYTAASGISQGNFYAALDKLLGNTFDREVASQLWQQANVNSKGCAQVQQIAQIIEEAQRILLQRKRQLSQTLRSLRQRQNELTDRTANSPQMQSLQSEMNQIERDLREYDEDLYLVSTPFGINLGGQPFNQSFHRTGESASPVMQQSYLQNGSRSINVNPAAPFNNYSGIDRSRTPGAFGSIQSEPMKQLFYTGIVLGILEVIVMYKKYDFLNLLVVTCILSIFLLKLFDKSYVMLCIMLNLISIVLDFLWLFLVGSNFWSPPNVSEYADHEKGYLKLIVIITILQMVIKGFVIVLLRRLKDVPEQSDALIPFPRMSIFKRTPFKMGTPAGQY